MVQEVIHPVGKVQLVLKSQDGTIKEQREENLVVQVGLNYIASCILSSTSSPFTYMALGTSSTPATLADTTLGSELVRQVFTSASTSANVVSISTTYAAGTGTGAITEAGIFNASSGGTMLSHVVFSVINKASTDTLTINWTITV